MIVVISTGNELVEPGEQIEPHQVRRSNAYGITAALREHGFARVADDHVRDDEAEIEERLEFPSAHARRADPLGRRVDGEDRSGAEGARDAGRDSRVPPRRAASRQTDVVRRVAVGPAVFALPGNPVSTLVCLARYVLPALRAAMGQAPPKPPRISLTAPFEVKAPLAFYLP